MATAAAPSCPGCQRLQAQLDAQRAQLEAVQATVTQLQEQLAAARKNSTTSSKPPSSDIVKPPKPPPAAQDANRSAGGQPGHPKHERAPFPPEQLTLQVTHILSACPGCGGPLRTNAHLARIVQQVDILPTPLTIEQHTCPEYWCGHCHQAYTAPLPAPIETGGLVGPRLTTLIAYLKGVCHASFSTARKFLRDVVGLTISRGQLAKVIHKVSAALQPLYDELLADLPHQAHLNVDETSHKDNGDLLWTWCFRAELYTLFQIDPTRSADVLLRVLGEEFDGVLGCDCFSAYRRYMRACGVPLQFCLAHLIREVKFLTTVPDARTRQYGERFLAALRHLFGVIHQREALSAGVFRSRLVAARAEVLHQATHAVPPSQAAVRLAKRMARYGECYFEFITTPGLEPTNNVAEQAIRFVVIDRHITQGTRSESGQRWCERIWTVIATCAQQGRSVFEYLHRAVVAYFHGTPAPKLQAVGED
jgi:transposase